MERLYFIGAKAVWAEGLETVKNIHLAFRTVIAVQSVARVEVRVAAGGIYKAFVNGVFAACGPARCGKGNFYVDELDLSRLFRDGENILTIEVVGYNVNSYTMLNQTPFLAAEVWLNGAVLRSTGHGDDFVCRIVDERVRKTQRYSSQRSFAEVYRCAPGYDSFGKDARAAFERKPLAAQLEKPYWKRLAPYSAFERLYPKGICGRGAVDFGFVCGNPRRDRSLTQIHDSLGYEMAELDTVLSDEMQNMAFTPAPSTAAPDTEAFAADSYRIFEMPFNASGMIGFSVRCNRRASVYAMFDEILTGGDVSTTRLGCCNGVKYTLAPGRYNLLCHEVYTFKYLKFAVDAPCHISGVHIVELKHPPVTFRVKIPESAGKLRLICDAAIETFRQNAVDIFMDCPSRERAGWLCDSFFTGRVEHCLTGANPIESAFLNNFLLASDFAPLPDGMLPMCYPGDHPTGRYIPNWAMWFVLELREHALRTGDLGIVQQARTKVLDLLKFFERFENEDGLLEKLESWVFIEWSGANKLTQDVNYPTNMLYAGMLAAAGELYGDAALSDKAERIRETVRRLSFDGEFFTDNAVRFGGRLRNTNEATEVCQYYAFFFDVATPAAYPALWKILVEKFGPGRQERNEYPRIYFANAFIGNYLRLDILWRYGLRDKLLEDIAGYFHEMAVKTGTLWENDTDAASCDHGFASHVACWLASVFGTEVRRISPTEGIMVRSPTNKP